MAKYRVKRFSSTEKTDQGGSIIGSVLKSSGESVDRFGRRLKFAGKRAGREVYAKTGVKSLGKAAKFLGTGYGTGAQIVAKDLKAAGEYSDNMAKDPIKTTVDSAKFLVTKPDVVLANAIPIAALPISTSLAIGSAVAADKYTKIRSGEGEDKGPSSGRKKYKNKKINK